MNVIAPECYNSGSTGIPIPTPFYITQITNFINNIISNEYTFKLCSIFQHFSWWLHGSEHPMYSLCSPQTYIMYLIKYLAITIFFSVISDKLLPYHILVINIINMNTECQYTSTIIMLNI